VGTYCAPGFYVYHLCSRKLRARQGSDKIKATQLGGGGEADVGVLRGEMRSQVSAVRWATAQEAAAETLHPNL
jgi:hypothetical protein